MGISVIDAFFILCVSSASLYVFRKLARSVGLVDQPNERKLHSGNIPLIGGVSICFTVVHYLYLTPFFLENNSLFIISICILTIVGAMDDKFDVSVKLRLLFQCVISLLMIVNSGVILSDFGNIFGSGTIQLGMLAIPITVLAMVGAMNAFNMVDGIDGLLGAISIVTFSSFAFLMAWSGQENKLYICVLFILAIIPFLLMNIGIMGRMRKVFMGDAGSMMIGFTIVWLLVGASQSEQTMNNIRPVTCLWLIAIPLFDMVSSMIRRVKSGRSPFKADREHIHHVLHKLGFKQAGVLLIICGTSSLCALVGVLGELYALPEYVMFWSFILTFLLYQLIVNRLTLATRNKQGE